jgi:RNase H-fold protein (predicted Holliday junction resolvase)
MQRSLKTKGEKKMKKILGLDLGSNSIGWALMRETDGEVSQIIPINRVALTQSTNSRLLVINCNNSCKA